MIWRFKRLFWVLFPKNIASKEEFIRLVKEGGCIVNTKRHCSYNGPVEGIRYGTVFGYIDFVGVLPVGEHRRIRHTVRLTEVCAIEPHTIAVAIKRVNDELLRLRTYMEELLENSE
jgi:hypothetical protein